MGKNYQTCGNLAWPDPGARCFVPSPTALCTLVVMSVMPHRLASLSNTRLSTFAYPIPGAGSAEPSGTVPTSPAFEKRLHLKVVPLPSRESSSRRRMSPLCCAAFLSLLYFATVKMRESAYRSLPAAASVCVRKTLLVCG
jgi:hypothetical protein